MTTRGGTDRIGRRSEVLVLDAARRGEAVDRASLAAQTELTPQAVSNVLTRLADARPQNWTPLVRKTAETILLRRAFLEEIH